MLPLPVGGNRAGSQYPIGQAAKDWLYWEQHARRLVLWVADQPIARIRQPVGALAKRGTVDLFTPVPFGTDERGRWVEVTLMFASVEIGAIPAWARRYSLVLGDSC